MYGKEVHRAAAAGHRAAGHSRGRQLLRRRVVLAPMAESARIPALDLLFGFGPVVLLAAAAVAAWAAPALAPAALAFACVWGAAILIFLSGVTRGLSFLTPGGPRPRQIAQMLWLFLLGLGGLLLPLPLAFGAQAIGYASVALFDRVAARDGIAPAYFARLRPPQMAIAAAALVALAVRSGVG